MAVSYESRYSVHPEYIPGLPEYKTAKHNLQMSGGQSYRSDGQLVSVCYCAYLIVMFRQTKLPVWDAIKKQDAEIDASSFLDSFTDGFEDGIAYFDKHYQQPLHGLYSSSEYVAAIKLLYFGDGSQWPEDHCQHCIRRQPITLERSQFRKIGHWSGITFRIESLMDKHPVLFPVETNHTADAAPVESLTHRERVLIYCYEEGMPISKGHPDYNDYITFATPRKRIAYPNESLKKLRSLIKSIETILPFLSETARKQADSELSTLILKNQ